MSYVHRFTSIAGCLFGMFLLSCLGYGIVLTWNNDPSFRLEFIATSIGVGLAAVLALVWPYFQKKNKSPFRLDLQLRFRILKYHESPSEQEYQTLAKDLLDACLEGKVKISKP